MPCCAGDHALVRHQTGLTYYDLSAQCVYIVYGADDAWEAIRYSIARGEQSTGIQTGTKPAALSALQALTYD